MQSTVNAEWGDTIVWCCAASSHLVVRDPSPSGGLPEMYFGTAWFVIRHARPCASPSHHRWSISPLATSKTLSPLGPAGGIPVRPGLHLSYSTSASAPRTTPTAFVMVPLSVFVSLSRSSIQAVFNLTFSGIRIKCGTRIRSNVRRHGGSCSGNRTDHSRS